LSAHAAIAFGLATLAGVLTACGRGREVSLGPGILAPEPPFQEALTATPLRMNGYELTPRARFEVTAKLLSRRRYRWDDLAGVASWDYAVGWGVLSDETWLEGTRVMQGNRLVFWHLYEVPLPLSIVERSSANIHLIGASDEVTRRFGEVPSGAIVTLSGRLVDVRLPDRRVIPTSLTRLDRGVGACEILLVDSISWTATRPGNQATGRAL
jgi:hypothetical protein